MASVKRTSNESGNEYDQLGMKNPADEQGDPFINN